MTGGMGKNYFDCGNGNTDSILDYNKSEGDTSTNDCEIK
jgi:hypothetical protein